MQAAVAERKEGGYSRSLSLFAVDKTCRPIHAPTSLTTSLNSRTIITDEGNCVISQIIDPRMDAFDTSETAQITRFQRHFI